MNRPSQDRENGSGRTFFAYRGSSRILRDRGSLRGITGHSFIIGSPLFLPEWQASSCEAFHFVAQETVRGSCVLEVQMP